MVDSVSGRPVIQAHVEILGFDGAAVASIPVDTDGRFSLRLLAPGTFRIRVRSIGHRPYESSDLTVGNADTVLQTLVLSPVPTELSPAEIRGDPADIARRSISSRRIREFYERLHRKDRQGSFATLEDIEHWNPHNPADLLQRMRGIKVRHNAGSGSGDPRRYIVYMTRTVTTSFRAQARYCPPLFFIDGVFVGDAERVPVETLLSVAEIEGVEAYSGSSGIPPEFNRTGSQCGVIAFWTR